MLSRLSEQALSLAGAAAVLGLHASPWLAGQVARLDSDKELPVAVDALVRANVLVGGVDGLTFVHPVIREATLAALGPLQESAMHGRAATALHAQALAAAPARPRPGGRAGRHAPGRRRPAHPRGRRVHGRRATTG